jgi:xylan 1,4-beta-xylosidase
MPELPLLWTEYNASYFFEPSITDSIYMGPWMANTIGQCDGLAEMMSFWTFTDIFEEQGVVKQPFYGGFGLIATGAIPKPAYNAFKLLHQLGEERIAADADSVLVTRRKDGSLVIAAWNLIPPDMTGATQIRGNPPGSAKTIHMRFEHLASARHAYICRIDRDHGDVHPAYEKMGQPRYPTQEQVKELQKAAELSPAEIRELSNGELTLDLAPDALALIEIK